MKITHSRSGRLLSYLASAACGAAMVLGFAPWGWWPVTVLALALWWVLAEHRGWGFVIGWFFGVGLFGAGTYWLYYSFLLFGDALAPVAALMSAGFTGFMALFPALFAALCRGLQSRLPLLARCLLLWPAAWVLIEWLRGSLGAGFPWLSVGYTQIDTPSAVLAPYAGVHALGLVVSMSAAALALALLRRRLAWVSGALLLVIWGGVFSTPTWEAQPAGEPMRVAAVQPNIAQHMKFLESQLEPSLRYLEAETRALEADLVLWPESAVPDFLALQQERVLGFAEQFPNTDIVSGIFTHQTEGADHRYFNSLVNLSRPWSQYRKVHLVPFGEYFPLRWLIEPLRRFILIPMSDLSHGDPDQAPLELAGHRAAAMICFEAAFGEQIRQRLGDATLLINVSNDAWFGRSSAPEQHLDISRMRALELARPMLRATNTGISAIVDHQGRVQARLEVDREGSVQGILQPMTGLTPYARLGVRPMLTLLLLLCGAACMPHLLRRGR